MEEARQYSVMILLFLAFLMVVLGAHHFAKARKALRTGFVEPLVLGFTRKQYSRKNDPEAFWANVCAGFLATVLGVFAALWLILMIVSLWAAYEGYPTL